MAAPGPLLLIVEDEPPIRRLLHTALSAHGFRLLDTDAGEKALRLAAQQPPDLIILDLGLPDLDGQEVIRRLREWLTAPILVLSARDQEKQKVAALDSGADDYLTKPFGTDELLARIRASLRRSTHPLDSALPTYEIGELRLNIAERRIVVRGEEVHLTPLEFKLLVLMVRHAGKVLTHRFLLKEVWGPLRDEPHHLRVLMAALRRKIERDPAQPQYLLTEQGVGYRFVSTASASADASDWNSA